MPQNPHTIWNVIMGAINMTYQLIRDNDDLISAYMLGKSFQHNNVAIPKLINFNPHQQTAVKWGYEDALEEIGIFTLPEILWIKGISLPKAD